MQETCDDCVELRPPHYPREPAGKGVGRVANGDVAPSRASFFEPLTLVTVHKNWPVIEMGDNKCLRGSPPPAPPPLSLTITATDISRVLSLFGFIFRGTPESQSQYSQLGGHMSKEKAPLTTVNFFTTGHWGPLWSQRKTGLLFSGYFSKF